MFRAARGGRLKNQELMIPVNTVERFYQDFNVGDYERDPFQEGNKFNYNEGEYIFATVAERKADTVTLLARNNFAFTVGADAVRGAVGEELKFQVVGRGKSLTLRQIEQRGAEGGARRASNKGGLFDFLKRLGTMGAPQNNAQDTASRNAEGIRLLKRQLEYAAGNAGRGSAEAMLENGLSPDKAEFGTVSSVMREEANERTDRRRGGKKADGTSEEPNEAEASAAEDENKRLGKALEERGLPATAENMKAVSAAVKQLKPAKILDTAAIMRLMETGAITPAGIYSAIYNTGHGKELPELNGSDWAQLRGEVGRVLEREGIAPDAGAYAVAKRFLEHGIPVSRDNFDKYDFLNNLNGRVSDDQFLDIAAESIRQGVAPADADIRAASADMNAENGRRKQALYEKYENIIAKIPRITGDTVRRLINRNEPLNLASLSAEADGLPAAAETTGPDTAEAYAEAAAQDGDTPLKVLTARRQFAELSLKLTHEAAARLAGKGLDITTAPLAEAVERLKAQEREGYAKSLRIMGAEATRENISRVEAVFDGMSGSRRLTHSVYGDVLSGRISFRLTELNSGVAEAETAAAQRAVASYARYETVPNPKYGDSFGKVADQFARFLNNAGIEASDENVEAAAILTRNGMDVNLENIVRVKTVDAKLDSIHNRLHPNIAASMIRDGFDALGAHVDEVLSYIDKFEDVYGNNLGDRIARYIAEMDASRSVSPEERSGIIALYRMLNTIQRSGSAALGVALKNNAGLTMGELMEAGQYYQRTGARREDVDISVDSTFGKVDTLVRPEHNIRKVLKDAYARAAVRMGERLGNAEAVLDAHALGHTEQNMGLLENVTDGNAVPDSKLLDAVVYNREAVFALVRSAAPQALTKLVKDGADIDGMSVEELTVMLKESASGVSSEFEVSRCAARLREMAKASPAALHWLQANGMSTAPQNLALMSGLIRSSHFIKDELSKLDGDDAESLADELTDSGLKPLEEGSSPTELMDKAAAALDRLAEQQGEALGGEDAVRYAALRRVSGTVRLMGRMSDGTDRQCLLVKLNGKIENLNIYFLNESRNTSSAILALTTDNSGDIRGMLNIDGERAAVRLSAGEGALEVMKEHTAELERMLGESGMTLESLNLGDEAYKTALYPSAAEGSRQSGFYRTVSAVVRFIEYTDGLLKMDY